MATDIGSIVVKIQADISDIKKGMESAQKSVSNFGTSTIVKGNLIADALERVGKTVLRFGIDSVKAYGEQEDAVARLSIAVGDKAANAFADYATELQRSTRYSDEAIISLQSQLANYGVLPGSIKSATLAVVNFAAATGKNLPEAGTAFAQAMSGNARELRRFGLHLDEGATRSENLAKVTEFLTGRFNDAAKTMRETVNGQVEGLANRINDLQERIGKLLTPAIKTMVGWLEKAVTFFEKVTGATYDSATASEKKMMALRQEQEILELAIKGYAEYRNEAVKYVGQQRDMDKAMRDRLIAVTNEIKALKTKKVAEQQVTDAISDQTGAIEENIDAGQDRINQLKKSAREEQQIQERITEITVLETGKRVMAARNAFEANASFSQALAVKLSMDVQSWGNIFAGTIIQIRDTFASSMADMIVNGGKFSEVMQNIGRQILEFFIETVIKQMVTQWMIGIGIMKAQMAALYSAAGVPVPAGLAATPGAGGMAGLGGLGAVGGFVGGIAAGSYLGGHAFGQKSSQGGANVGAGIGTIAGMALLGPLGGILGGALGGLIGGGLGKSLTKIRKKLFSGGVLGEPSLIMGMKSGGMAIAGEDGPEALVSFRDDLGITPAQGRARLTGSTPAGVGAGAGGGISINISGQFLEATPGKWQRMFRSQLLPEIRRYTGISPVSPFIRRRGQS